MQHQNNQTNNAMKKTQKTCLVKKIRANIISNETGST